MSLSLLDGSVAKLVDAIPNLSLGELESLRAAEEAGKTRKGAIAALDEAIAACEPEEAPEAPEEAPAEPVPDEPAPEAPEEVPSGSELVKNIIPGSDITLHDGGHLLFGETAPVPADLAALLRERGQVK